MSVLHKAILRFGWKGWLACGLVVLLLSLAGGFLFWNNSSTPGEAPEAERVLAAQVEMPFQVLIPAYLPRGIDRERVEIDTSLTGPAGEPMIQLTYPIGRKYSLVIQEWLPLVDDSVPSTTATASLMRIVRCRCCEQSTELATEECILGDMEIAIGPLHIIVRFSAENLVTAQQWQTILDTLGPAANQQVFSSLSDVPLTYSVPPAVEIPISADGVQEIDLVITPGGYEPPHVSVLKGVPVKLIFRQLGYVGCGNELLLQWGKSQGTTVLLASESDKKVIEFTPNELGDFPYNCPHLIYRGVLTVRE